ncbi:MAG: hypothetical protein Tsb0010_14430 [Parvularculaceae bacterium]
MGYAARTVRIMTIDPAAAKDGTPERARGGGDVIARNCPACGSAMARDLPQYSRPPWRVVKCSGCRFVYQNAAPAYDRLKSEFAWEKTFAAESRRRKEKSPIIQWLDQATRWRLHIFRADEAAQFRKFFPQGNVLDIGCGEGRRAPEPFTPYGVEISEVLWARAHERMSARGGRAVHAPAVAGVAQFPERFFSGVIMRSFLEHEAEPRRLLAACRRVLRDDGVVYVKVPNFSSLNRRIMGGGWCGFRYPDHVNYFTLSSLKSMCEGEGFAFRLLNVLNFPLDDNIHALLRKAA